MPLSGSWIWNDQTKSLEFLSLVAKEETTEKKKNKTSTYHEHFKKHLEKWQKNAARPAQLDAFKTSIKCSQKACVTIQDVKLAAVCLIQENEDLPISLRFLAMLKSRELDEFLAHLLLYFSCFFEKKTLEERPKSLMAEESEAERRTAAGTRLKVDLALKRLATSYTTVLLGKHLAQHRHTAHNRMKVSSTHSDIPLDECLYSFCIYAVWVTFERRDLKAIQLEIGHLFRSDAFNPALETERSQSEETEEDQSSQSEVVAHQQTALNNRKPKRRAVLSQRSPLIVSLLPTPRENAPHLFQGFRRLPPPWMERCEAEALTEELQQQLDALSFGILGKPLSHFSSCTLKPQEGQSEEEEEEEEEGDEVKVHIRNSKTSRSLTTIRDRLSSRVELVSRATTEAVSSDTE